MTSNFQFLQHQWPAIYEAAREAEENVIVKPNTCRMYARMALELGINWMFEHDSRLIIEDGHSLGHLIANKSLKPITTKPQRRSLMLLKNLGNAGVHGRALKEDEVTFLKRFGPDDQVDTNSATALASVSLQLLFEFLSYLAVSYSETPIETPVFDATRIPAAQPQKETAAAVQEIANKHQQQLEKEQTTKAKQKTDQSEDQQQEQEAKRQTIAQRATTRAEQSRQIPQLVSEAATRKFLIDTLLKDAGWHNLKEGRELEFKLKGMPASTNPSGIGYADYVLWGKDGKPLAVVEAKRSMSDPRAGRHQVCLYADCLEQMYQQRPVLFYTNGYETYLWDDTFYADRLVDGFYTQDELQQLIDRRKSRKDIRTFTVNKAITDRPYQMEAIRRVAENFVVTGKQGQLLGASRKSLLVMATGSGKTRTAASLVEMLFKCNWARRVLFLADRNALVKQAKKAFNAHLPELSAINLTQNKEDNTARLVFSTYPTMMNRIDKIRSEGKRFFGVGHFDLIIIDEAHRSVYQKYRAIFEYFDSLLIGLTATPKTEIDRNTYSLFEIEDDDPTFAYELDQAVKELYLVPYSAMSVPLKFQREGIKYAELSDREKEQYEEKFGDPTQEEAPEEIGSAALNKWLFNTDTVDKVLELLMDQGIKVDGGDKIGKTIVFARNHDHAMFIQERFNKQYPEYGSHFLKVIDNYEKKAQDLLDQFKDEYKEQDPQIAVSVDMMDTGVDAPRVVNLVFFKIVKSYAKFWQMIGRGTRLCPNLFGPGQNKTEFLIFDFCQNFEYFDLHPKGASGSAPKPLQQQIFEAKLLVAQLLNTKTEKTEDDQALRTNYLNQLHLAVSSLDDQRFQVRRKLKYVNQFTERSTWDGLSVDDVETINTHLSNLEPPEKGDHALSRRFDVLVLHTQLVLLNGGNVSKYYQQIYKVGRALEQKANVPEVADQLDLIQEIQTEHYWTSVHPRQLEEIRVALRELMRYLEKDKQVPVYTTFEDELGTDGITTRSFVSDPSNSYGFKPYKERVEAYIRENRHLLAIHKLCTNVPITREELSKLEDVLFTDGVAGSRAAFEAEFGNQPLGAFIRSVTGLDSMALQEAFTDFLQTGTLRANQITFVRTIIDYLSKNGTIDKELLFESPFTELHDEGLTGVFKQDAQVVRLIQIIDEINGNASVA